MGNCCGGGDEEDPQAADAGATGAGGDKKDAKGGDKKKKDTMAMESEGGPDAEAFDIAFRSSNIEGLVKLMDSREKISTQEQMHQWAKNPTTIGALAGTQLAIRASMAKPPEGSAEAQSGGYDPEMKVGGDVFLISVPQMAKSWHFDCVGFQLVVRGKRRRIIWIRCRSRRRERRPNQ